MAEKKVVVGEKRIDVDKIYPVGSVYISVSSTSPATLFGGTWTQIKDRFLIGAGSTYSVKSTGGEATHTLTAAEVPSRKSSAEKSGYGLSASTYFKDRVLVDFTGGAHNNLPPYFAVYIWYRTA